MAKREIDSEEGSVFNTVSEDSVSRTSVMTRRIRSTKRTVQILADDPRTLVSSLVIGVYLLMGTVGVMIVPTPYASRGPMLLGPFQSLEYPLGTTGLGTGLARSMVHATPFMLKLMISGAAFTAVVALVVGLTSGYRGGYADRILSTVMDTAIAVPGLPLYIVLATLFQPTSPYVIGVILAVNRWAGLARQVRSEALSIKEEPYVEASEAMGMTERQLLYDDFLPNIMPFVMIRFANAAKGIIYASVALYFLGLLPSSGANWGVQMNTAYNLGNALSRPEAFHWLLVPMLTIIVLSWALATFAQGADRIFNPRIRTRVAGDSGDGE